MECSIAPSTEPLEIGKIVHLSRNVESDDYAKNSAWEIQEINPSEQLENYSYTVRPAELDQDISRQYNHQSLIPSPRGYEYIDALLGDPPTKGEELLGKFRRPKLELINTCLSVVDIEDDQTKDWVNEIRKKDIDRINSIIAEMLLLYHLRSTFGYEQVSLNAKICGSDSKDFDIHVTAEEEDIWIEVVKPDFSASLPEEVGFISGDTTGNSIDRKLKNKFRMARDELPEGTVLILANYVEQWTMQGMEIGQWLDEDYYDVGDICDGWLTYSGLGKTDFDYRSFTEAGKASNRIFERMLDG